MTSGPMVPGQETLTEKEKATLRLLGRGHDAKSTARHLGLSVHTINERLRDARRKLSVSSSREAARLLLDSESGGADPEKRVDTSIGDARDPPGVAKRARHATLARRATIGAVIMSLALGLLALATMSPDTDLRTTVDHRTAAIAETDVTASAREWLTLVDRNLWVESWNATAESFRKLNTTEAWASASRSARVPLGAMRARKLIAQEAVPAPPAGIEVVKFRTQFANKVDTIETVSLARENGAWRVVGYYID